MLSSTVIRFSKLSSSLLSESESHRTVDVLGHVASMLKDTSGKELERKGKIRKVKISLAQLKETGSISSLVENPAHAGGIETCLEVGEGFAKLAR